MFYLCAVLLAVACLLVVSLCRSMKRGFALAFAVLMLWACGGPVYAQSTQVANLYAAGLSYNSSGTPAIAGTALYAHQVSADTAPGLYAFAMYDVLPNSRNPLTVTNSVGVGVAQKAFTVAGVDVFVPTAAGVAYSGSNVGWAWNTGVMAPIRYKQTQYYFAPTIRVSKASVGGDGYTVIPGLLFAWGK